MATAPQSAVSPESVAKLTMFAKQDFYEEVAYQGGRITPSLVLYDPVNGGQEGEVLMASICKAAKKTLGRSWTQLGQLPQKGGRKRKMHEDMSTVDMRTVATEDEHDNYGVDGAEDVVPCDTAARWPGKGPWMQATLYVHHATIAAKLTEKKWAFGEDMGIKFYSISEPFDLHECVRVEYHTVKLSVEIGQTVSEAEAIKLQETRGVQVRRQAKLKNLRAELQRYKGQAVIIEKHVTWLLELIGREDDDMTAPAAPVASPPPPAPPAETWPAPPGTLVV